MNERQPVSQRDRRIAEYHGRAFDADLATVGDNQPIHDRKQRRFPGAILTDQCVRVHRDLIDLSVFTDWPFIVFVIATMVGFIGLTIALFYLSLFALVRDITDEDTSFYIVPLYNAASVFGRIAPNYLSDRIGSFNVITPCAFITGILLMCLQSLRAGQVGAIVILTILLGFFSGVFVAIPGTCFPYLTRDKSMLGTRVGMAFSVIGFGMLIGGPGAGRVLDSSTGSNKSLNFMGLWMFGGISTIVSGLLYVMVRFLLVGCNLLVRA